MHLAENHIDLPGIGDIPSAVLRVARRAASLAAFPIDHVTLCVEPANMSRYVARVRQQVPEATASEFCIGEPDSGMRIIELQDRNAGVHVVLAAPTGARGQVAEFLATRGAEGLQHVGFAVPDARAAVIELAALGLRFVGGAEDPERAIVEVREGDRSLRQAFTEPLFGGFFVELIERNGIVDLRPQNIGSLFALKEGPINAVQGSRRSRESAPVPLPAQTATVR